MKKIGLKEVSVFLWIYACVFALQIFAVFISMDSFDQWYGTLNKVAWNPPDAIFAPVWTVLYVIMAFSVWIVYIANGIRKCEFKIICYRVFALQLFCNFLWSFFFFYLHSPVLALIDIFALLTFIFLCIIYFYKVNRAASMLMIPYFLWVLFATALNISIVVLN